MMKRFLPLLILFLWFPNVSHAAIAYGGISAVNRATTNSLSYSVTTSGTNVFLVVDYFSNNATDVATGITFNGVSMTKLATSQNTTGVWLGTYVLGNAYSGTANVIVSSSASVDTASVARYYTGAQTSSTVDSKNSGSNSSTASFGLSTITVANNSWVIGSFKNSSGASATAGSNTTIRQNGSSGFYQTDSNISETPAGSYSQNLSVASAAAWDGFVFSIAPAITPTSLTSILTSWVTWIL